MYRQNEFDGAALDGLKRDIDDKNKQIDRKDDRIEELNKQLKDEKMSDAWPMALIFTCVTIIIALAVLFPGGK